MNSRKKGEKTVDNHAWDLMQFLWQDALRLSMLKGQDYGKMYLHLVHHQRRPLISKDNIPSYFFNVTILFYVLIELPC